MEMASGIVLAAVLVIVLVFVVPRLIGGGNYVVCTRCDGTGEVNERWPDPNEPTGFHVAKGKCPRCNGKGKVRT